MQRRSRLAVILVVLLTLGLEGSAGAPAPKGFVGSYRWAISDRLFGGWSGIEVESDGISFTALSDRGAFVQGRFQRAADGAIIGITSGKITPLKSNTSKSLHDFRRDSEDLALAPDGSFFISFEGAARVLKYRKIDGLAENLPTPPAFAAFPRNASLESLAVDANGVLYTFPEELIESKRARLLTGQPGNPNGADFPVWRFARGKWTQPFALKRRGSFLPVSADFGPDGRLYVLERDFRGIIGFASRIRSFKVGAKGLSAERLILQSPIGVYDNLEGLSVWRDAGGAIRLTMVSDNNFLPIQRTEFVEYSLGN